MAKHSIKKIALVLRSLNQARRWLQFLPNRVRFTLGHGHSPKPLISMFVNSIAWDQSITSHLRLCSSKYFSPQHKCLQTKRTMQKWLGTMAVTQCGFRSAHKMQGHEVVKTPLHFDILYLHFSILKSFWKRFRFRSWKRASVVGKSYSFQNMRMI